MKDVIGVEGTGHRARKHLRISWNIGKRCNYECSYCPPHLHDKTSSHWSHYEMKKMVNYLMPPNSRPVWFSITGGEPFLNPDLYHILKYIHDLPSVEHLIVTSNGSSSLARYLQALKWVDMLTISWHWEYIQSTNGLRNVLRCLQQEIDTGSYGNPERKLTVNLMAVPGEQKRTQIIYDDLLQSGIRVSLRRIVGNKGYYSHKELDWLEGIEKSSNHENLFLYKKDGSVERSNFNDLILRDEYSFTGWICWAGVTSIYVDPELKVYRGQCMEGSEIYGPLDKPVICSKPTCPCTTDISVLKYDLAYEKEHEKAREKVGWILSSKKP